MGPLRRFDENIGNHIRDQTIDLFVVVDIMPGLVGQRDDKITQRRQFLRSTAVNVSPLMGIGCRGGSVSH
jgi:hypothetical protein